jgi:tetratricopeptide (TPR) repeat protein
MSYSALSICISLVLSRNILLSSEYAHCSHSLEREKIALCSAGSFDRTVEDRLNQAKELLFERHYSAAEQRFREIIDDPAAFQLSSPRLADVHNYLAVTLHCQQRDAEAIESYKRALFLHPKVFPSAIRAQIYSNLALSLSSMGMREEALKSCRLASDHFRHSDVDALTYSVFLNAYGQLLIEDKDWAGA